MPNNKDAKKKAALKRSASRSAGRTRTTMATPGKVQEAGVTAASVAKIVQQVIKQMSKPKASTAKPKAPTSKRTTASQAQRDVASTRAANQSYRDSSVRAQQRMVDERLAKAAKDQKAADAIRTKARNQGVTRASGGSRPKGSRKYN